MQTTRSIEETRSAIASARRTGKTIGFVPTMGFLHEGHLSLIETLRREGASFIVVSIFVNPTQFGANEDLSTYPRDEERDTALLLSRNVDLLFAPPANVMYPDGFGTSITVGGVSEPLEGARRPGHFAGVATVVAKLFNIVQPDLAAFGQKDAQQCAVVKKLVRDLDLPVRLVIGDIVREADGLAMSSRNSYLSPEERLLAPALHDALLAGAEAVLSGGGDLSDVESKMRDRFHRAAPEAAIDYLTVVDPETFLPPEDAHRELLVVGAVRVGRTRLIDNVKIPQPSLRRQNAIPIISRAE